MWINKRSIGQKQINIKIAKRFRSKEVIKIALSANDVKRIGSVDSIETHAHRISKKIIHKSEDIKYSNVIKQSNND